MRSTNPRRLYFRPRLERLEGRDVPSSALTGQTLFGLTLVEIEVQATQGQVQALQNDLSQLHAHLVANGGGSAAFTPTIVSDYALVGLDLGAVGALNTSAHSAGQLFNTVALNGYQNGDANDRQLALIAYRIVNGSGTPAAPGLLGTVDALRDQSQQSAGQSPGTFTVNGAPYAYPPPNGTVPLSNPVPAPVTVSGRVTAAATGVGVAKVPVQLIDAAGDVAATTSTDASGNYSFDVDVNGPYVVRESTPSGFTQTNLTFANTAPTGSYAAGAGNGSWNYGTNTDPTRGPVGPADWALIAPAGSLPFQGPVNLTGPTVDLGKYVTVSYAATAPSSLVNNGHLIQVQFTSSGADSVSVGGQQFDLTQFDYHDPSENLVNGNAYSMEEHFVNVSATGGETVVAVFLQVGAHNDALQPILDAATANLTSPNSKTTLASTIDFAGLLPTSTQGWFYQGSLTTPPLSQPVNWFVYATPITLDAAQLTQYEQVARAAGFLPNARPVQPLDGRQLNESDYNVNVQGQSVSGLNFTLQPATG